MFLGLRLRSKFGVLLCVSHIDTGSLFRFCASDSVRGSMSALKQKSPWEKFRFPKRTWFGVHGEKTLLADDLEISKWQTSSAQFAVIVMPAFLEMAEWLQESYFIMHSWLVREMSVICSAGKDWNYYQPLYVICWPYVCLKWPWLNRTRLIDKLCCKLALKTHLNR